MSETPGAREVWVDGGGAATARAPAAPAASRTAEAERYPLLAPLRVLAMLVVVGYHLRGEMLFGLGFGLPILQVFLCALVARRPEPLPLGVLLARKAKRLLTPWILWSCVYGAVATAGAIAAREAPLAWLERRMVLYGTAMHLWFLPYSMLAVVAVGLLQRGVARVTPSRGASVAVAAGLGVATAFASVLAVERLAPGPPFLQWTLSLPTIPFGLAVGRALSLPEEQRKSWLVRVAALSQVPWLLMAVAGDPHRIVERLAVGVPLACAGFVWRPRPDPVTRFLAPLNLGVYLVHVLVLWLVLAVPGGDALPSFELLASVYALSCCAVLGLRRLGVPHLA